MLKLTLVFLITVAYAAQTRIKIGSKSWGYQIDLNRGNQIRNEFSNENGVTTGFYQFKVNNQTKKLEYTIDPNRMEPDINFDVVNVEAPVVDDADNNSTTMSPQTQCPMPNSNMTFDSIDSNQDFKGHVTLKVGNTSYSINFATGDKSNSREEVLTPNGLLYGRYNYMLVNSPHKIVINYKFNSTSPDPTFEVSLFKSSGEIEAFRGPSDRDHSGDRIHSHGGGGYPSASYRARPYHRSSPYAAPTATAVQHPSAATGGAGGGAVPASHSLARAHQDQSRSMSEKFRSQSSPPSSPPSSSSSSSSASSSSPPYHPYHHYNPNIPSWYYNRIRAQQRNDSEN